MSKARLLIDVLHICQIYLARQHVLSVYIKATHGQLTGLLYLSAHTMLTFDDADLSQLILLPLYMCTTSSVSDCGALLAVDSMFAAGTALHTI